MRLTPLFLAFAALVPAACTDSVGPEFRQPAMLVIVDGHGQVGAAGSRLEAPISVRLLDKRRRPVAGKPVSFVVTAGGGSVTSAAVATSRDGLAQTWWTVGPSAGTAHVVEARVTAGATVLTTTFGASVTPGAAARLVRHPVPDDSTLVSGIGAVLTDSLAVQVLDSFGNPVPGVEVVWTAPDGSGTVATPTPTDSLGVARTTWRLGSLTDQSAYASVAGVAELRFVAQAATQLSWRCDECRVLEAGSRVRIGVAPQYGSAGGPPAAVAFEAAPGSGTVTPAVSTSEAGGSTTGSGVAWVEWTLGDAPGPQKLTARLGGLQVEYVIDALPWLVPVAQVPGTVLDATSDRVLWASPGQLRIRTVATGADVTVPSGFPDGGAALFDGGALLWNRTGRLIVEYRNGEVAGLGTYAAASPPSVEGNWAAWGVEMNPGSYGADFIIRRDLVSGTSLFLPDPGAPGAGGRSIGRGPDVGPRGEVAFIEGHLVPWGFSWMHVRLYREGSFGGFGFTNVRDVQTDGINVATSTLDPGFHHIEPSTVLCLHTSLGVTCPTKGEWNVGFAYLLAGGWFAYFKGEERAVFRRSPAGVTEPMPHCWSIEALAPDGTLVCGYDHRYRLIPPGGTGYSAGRWNGEDRVVWRGDRFLVLRDGGVYTLGPAPAATSR